MDTTITMLGTGHATVTKCYNTCFVLRHGEENFLVDAGGGNGILVQMEKAGISVSDIHQMFLTHGHTDHILGAVWVVRIAAIQMKHGNNRGPLHIYANEKAAGMLRIFCEMTLCEEDRQFLENGIYIHTVRDGEEKEICGMNISFFDIHSTKEPQFGFRAVLEGGKALVCLGDEPYNEKCREYVEGADWLMSEAFCLYSERERFKPYEKCHSTAMDAGKLAEFLGVQNLLIYHTEDQNLSRRRELYTEEAGIYFTGNIVVPKDLEVVPVL